jgi:molecular chaperone HscA
MALLQIAEPGQLGEPHRHNFALGIDLGTTNSLVATLKSGVPTVLTGEDGARLVPSIVHYSESSAVVGAAARQKLLKDPANTIVSIKRFMGQSFSDLDPAIRYPYQFVTPSAQIQINTRRGVKNPVQISADILSHLRQLALKSMGEDPVGVVITVPAYFDDAQRQATKQAGELAGLKVLRLLNEPTAAAIAYGLDQEQEGTFLVYDLGGGTLDVSILRLHQGVFEVLAVSGDTRMGGDDFDQRLFCYFLEKSNLSQLTDEDIVQLLLQARAVKEQFSTKEKVAFSLVLSSKRIVNLSLTRAEFEAIVQQLVQKAMLPLKKVLRDAGVLSAEIDQVIMVGGSTRMICIRNAVAAFFGKEPLTSINPDEVVAIGAALQADVLAGNKKDNWLLLDVTPLSLGVETMGGLVEKIIPRNSTIPVVKAQDFTTYKDGQTAMTIHVVQGERELVQDCRSLARFTLRGIPPLAAAQAKVRITYQIDADGLLEVSARELNSGVISSIEVNPSYGLNEDQIGQMLQQSLAYAKTDMHQRMYQEAVVEAQALLDSVEKALCLDMELLSEFELQQINHSYMKLNLALKRLEGAQNLDKISQLSTELNHVSEILAAKRMDKVINKALSGKSITSLE